MSYNRTPSEILKHDLSQAACHGAPADVMANLRGALAFCEAGQRIERKAGSKTINQLIPAEPVVGEVADE